MFLYDITIAHRKYFQFNFRIFISVLLIYWILNKKKSSKQKKNRRDK